MKVKIHKRDGSDTGKKATLDASVFGVEPSDHSIWLDVRRIQAHARQGTHKAKDRGETAGSTRKLYRQKGTGGSRAGSAKSPIRRSGGTIFGPRPHAYSLKVNRKTRHVARRSALTYKALNDGVRVVEDFGFDVASTKELAGMLAALELAGRKVLVLTGGHAPMVYRSGRNLPGVSVRSAAEASTLDLVGAQVLLIQQSALDVLANQLGSATETA